MTRQLAEKHPDCEDRCQLREHKRYRDCAETGECAYAATLSEAPQPAKSPIPCSGGQFVPREHYPEGLWQDCTVCGKPASQHYAVSQSQGDVLLRSLGEE